MAHARVAAAALFAVAAAQYAWNAWAVTPLTGYDAGPHAGYILSILAEGRLPHPFDGWSTFHPPLYYLAASRLWPLLEPLGPETLVAGLRGLAALGQLVAGLVTWLLVRRLDGGAAVAWVATALVLFVPCGQMAAAMIGNEAFGAGMSALVLLPLLALQRDPRNAATAALAGVLAALAFVTKYTGGFAVAACVVPFLRVDFDRAMLRALAVGAVCGAIVAGPVYARNLFLTGTPFPILREFEPTKSVEDANVLRPRRVTDYLWVNPAALRRPSLHHVAGDPPPPPPRRNPAMTNVWGLAYASTWYDAQGHRIPLPYHRDGVVAGPALVLLGLGPTLAMLLGFALALAEAVRRRGRSPDAPLVAQWLTGLALFVAYTAWAPAAVAVKGSYLLPLAPAGGVFFARGVARLRAAWRPWLLGAAAAAALASAVVFTSGLVFPPQPPELMAGRWKMIGAVLPHSYVAEAAETLIR